MWHIQGISVSNAPNKILLCRLDFRIRPFVHQCDSDVTVRLLRDNESCMKRKTPPVAAGWTAPRWCYEQPFKVAPLPRWSKVELRRTEGRHELTIYPPSQKKKTLIRQAMLRKHTWTFGYFMESESKEFPFCPHLCRTWRLRLHWSNLN